MSRQQISVSGKEKDMITEIITFAIPLVADNALGKTIIDEDPVADSNIRIPSPRTLLRMLESKDHWQTEILVEYGI